MRGQSNPEDSGRGTGATEGETGERALSSPLSQPGPLLGAGYQQDPVLGVHLPPPQLSVFTWEECVFLGV